MNMYTPRTRYHFVWQRNWAWNFRLIYFNSAVNPILYTFFGHGFKEKVTKVWKMLKRFLLSGCRGEMRWRSYQSGTTTEMHRVCTVMNKSNAFAADASTEHTVWITPLHILYWTALTREPRIGYSNTCDKFSESLLSPTWIRAEKKNAQQCLIIIFLTLSVELKYII